MWYDGKILTVENVSILGFLHPFFNTSIATAKVKHYFHSLMKQRLFDMNIKKSHYDGMERQTFVLLTCLNVVEPAATRTLVVMQNHSSIPYYRD